MGVHIEVDLCTGGVRLRDRTTSSHFRCRSLLSILIDKHVHGN